MGLLDAGVGIPSGVSLRKLEAARFRGLRLLMGSGLRLRPERSASMLSRCLGSQRTEKGEGRPTVLAGRPYLARGLGAVRLQGQQAGFSQEHPRFHAESPALFQCHKPPSLSPCNWI